MNKAVAILRLQEGLDCSEILSDIDELIRNKSPANKKVSKQTSVISNEEMPTILGIFNRAMYEITTGYIILRIIL